MSTFSRAGRARRIGSQARLGRARATTVATRLGIALRDARNAAALSQSEVADRAGVSQPFVSHLERGFGTNASIESWSLVCAAVGEQFVGFLERAPGADRPRDLEHLRRQSALIGIAESGGWSALPELALDPGAQHSRSVDVALIRQGTQEAVVAEIWDWFDDVGAGLRGLDGKVAALAARLSPVPTSGPDPRWCVGGLFIVRDTRRNRALVDELRPLFASRFDGSSVAWLAALTTPDVRVPVRDGLLWSSRDGTRFRARRLRRGS
jgi:transcriptional regulator with XRE-family HTH domain